MIKSANYEGCSATFREAEVVLIGAGYEGTANFRPGSKFAPDALRRDSLLSRENYSHYFQKDLNDSPLHDFGNEKFAGSKKSEALNSIEAVCRYCWIIIRNHYLLEASTRLHCRW